METLLKALVLVVVAGGLIQMIVALVRRRRESAARSRLWLDGVGARARVLELHEVGGYKYGSRRVELDLEITGPSFTTQSRVAVVVPISALSQLQPSSVLEVRVDPDDPSRVALDPMLSEGP